MIVIDVISLLIGFLIGGLLMWLAGITVILIYTQTRTWWQLVFWMWVYPYYFFGSFWWVDPEPTETEDS